MPTYAYACTECGHEFDAQQSFSEDSLTSCPACEGRLRKKFGAVGVVFKGSGFYRNDSRNGSGAASSGGSDDKGSDSGSGDKGSGDKGSDKSPDKVSSGTSSSDSSGSGSSKKVAAPASTSSASTGKGGATGSSAA